MLHLLLLSGMASAASAPSPAAALQIDAGAAPYEEVVACVRGVRSKRLLCDRALDGGHRFFFGSRRTSGVSNVHVTIFRDDDVPVRVLGMSGEWLGVDERLAAEIEKCAGEEVAVLRRKRFIRDDAQRHMPSASLQMLREASMSPPR